MFVARDYEMSVLEEAHASRDFEMVVVYGRRRVGKTRLLREFCRGKGRVHFFAPRYAAAIEAGMTNRVAERICAGDFSDYMGRAFEEACRQWASRAIASGEVDMVPSAVGSWWGTDPSAREQVDVDVVAAGADGELFAGECKWTIEPVDVGVLETLRHRAGLVVDRPSSIELALFSKSGFARGCEREAARAGNVRLVTPADMFG